MSKQKQELTQIVGAVVIVGLVGVVIVGSVYGVMGTFDHDTLRWVATFAVLAVPVFAVIVWKLATNTAREHLRGHERGVSDAEKTIQAVGRGLSATASMARAVKAQPTPTHDDLLPKVGQMKILKPPHGGDDVIDL